MSTSIRLLRISGAALASLALLSPGAPGQYAERPDLPGSGAAAVDCSGRSIKNKRVRAVHTTDPALAGGTAYLFERDPFLAYQLGRNLNFREFRPRDGVFDAAISGLGGPMPDGTTAKITTNNQVSCSGCHNLPQGNPGGGVSFSKDSGFGRNSPHYYGAGITEMLGIQIRAEILAQVDGDGDGWVSSAEARAAPAQVLVQASPSGPLISYGSPRLSGGAIGEPRFNNIVRVWYVDRRGRHVPDAIGVDGVSTFGYNFELIVYGWGQGPRRSALNPTNRAFLWDPFKAHSGLEAYDPSTTDDPDGDGVSEPTLAGAIQFPATHVPPDVGNRLDPTRTFSVDDPDGDGYLNELSEGDLDLGEWFMLNAPRPAYAGTPQQYAQGVGAMHAMGCTVCHVPDWTIRAADDTFAGDRRLFDLEVAWNPAASRLEGRLVPLYTKLGGSYVRQFGAFEVRGIFADFRHHDMGERYQETDFGGTTNRKWRTAPLWGVGSGFPWDHDGRSLTLRDSIVRHDGEAAASRDAFLAAPPGQRAKVIHLLRNLVLYDVESLPADVDGDGQVADHFQVAGRDTGLERLNAEWMFARPVVIQGPLVNADGTTVTSFAATNVDVAYGQGLFYRRDSDDDGWPDVWDLAPNSPGYKNGLND